MTYRIVHPSEVRRNPYAALATAVLRLAKIDVKGTPLALIAHCSSDGDRKYWRQRLQREASDFLHSDGDLDFWLEIAGLDREAFLKEVKGIGR